jgi:hypothetical protein
MSKKTIPYGFEDHKTAGPETAGKSAARLFRVLCMSFLQQPADEGLFLLPVTVKVAVYFMQTTV